MTGSTITRNSTSTCSPGPSPRLSSTIATLRGQSEPYVRFAVTADMRFRHDSNMQHREMVNLIRKHDADGIAAVVTEHLMRTRRELDKLMAVGWTAGTPRVRL